MRGNALTEGASDCHGKTTILVVEDDVLTRMAVSEELRDHGYSVIEAANADEALCVLLQVRTRVDLLLTDMRMPGAVDGCGLARQVRAALPFVKIVMVSGQAPEPEAHSMLDGYLAKPVAPRHLATYLLTLSPTGLPAEAS
jgi:CheY-like chemotaxis protein